MSDQSEIIAIRLQQARMVATRLERLTPDSSWAHRASGSRGTLLRLIQRLDKTLQAGSPPGDEPPPASTSDLLALEMALGHGFFILQMAARERMSASM